MFAAKGPKKQTNDFNPHKAVDKRNKHDSSKLKQKQKNNGKSFTFNKK